MADEAPPPMEAPAAVEKPALSVMSEVPRDGTPPARFTKVRACGTNPPRKKPRRAHAQPGRA
jgi:hypothetical protein